MIHIATQDELNQVINKMIEVGITPPQFEDNQELVRFNTEGCLNNSCYYYLTEGIRLDKSNYLIASFGCFERNIKEYVCTLNERPLGVDESFYSNAYKEHQSIVKEQKERYLSEIGSNNHKSKIGTQTDPRSQALEDKQEDVYSTDINKTKESQGQTVNSFIFYDSFFNALKYISDDKLKLDYLESIIYYGLFRKSKEQNPQVQGMFELIKPQLDANYKRWVDGKKGGRPKKLRFD